MSDGIGRGGNSSRRSPPRHAEDRDSTVTLRSTRGTGLPPRILSSGRGRGGLGIGRGVPRGSGSRNWPVVRPQSGSVPPWANRKAATNIPYTASRLDGPRHEERRQRPGNEALIQPKWERERIRTLSSPPRTMSNSISSASRTNETSLGYSAGPSHQRWMAPGEEPGPSKYSVYEPREELEPPSSSAISSPSTSTCHTQSNTISQDVSNDDMHKSLKLEADSLEPMYTRESSRPATQTEASSSHNIRDEKEDTFMDTPGAGPSRISKTSQNREVAVDNDIKPDLSTMSSKEIPSVPDEDREDGVLAVK